MGMPGPSQNDIGNTTDVGQLRQRVLGTESPQLRSNKGDSNHHQDVNRPGRQVHNLDGSFHREPRRWQHGSSSRQQVNG